MARAQRLTADMDYVRGERLDVLREGHGRFVAGYLRFGRGLELSKGELLEAYASWLGLEDASPHDVRNLHLGLLKSSSLVEWHEDRLLGVAVDYVALESELSRRRQLYGG